MAKVSKKIKHGAPLQDSDWQKLRELIKEFGEASRADEMKGGGDPLDYQTIEMQLQLTERKLGSHIAKMQRACGMESNND